MLFMGDKGALYCFVCKRGKRRCKQCKKTYDNPKEDGLTKRTSGGDGWYCWHCMVNPDSKPYSFEEQDWVKLLLRETDPSEEEIVLQVCTVTFTEITEDDTGIN